MLKAYAAKAPVARRVGYDAAIVHGSERLRWTGSAGGTPAALIRGPRAAASRDRRAEPHLGIQANHGFLFRAGPGPRPPARRTPGTPHPAPGQGHRATGQLRRLAGASPALAQLYASIAASEATHVTALSTLAALAGKNPR